MKYIITVLELESENLSKTERTIIEDFITTKIINSAMFTVIDRKQRNVLLDEIEFSLSECSDESCQIQLGKLLSADKIIVGNLNKIEEIYILNLKQIDVETGITISSFSEQYASISEIIEKTDNIIYTFLLKTGQFENPADKQDEAVVKIINELSHLTLSQMVKKDISEMDLYSIGITSRMYIYKEVKKNNAWLFCLGNIIPGLGSALQGDHLWALYQGGSFLIMIVAAMIDINNDTPTETTGPEPWRLALMLNGGFAALSGFITPWLYENNYNNRLKKKLGIP
ncbi:MAG: hypothetical protein JW881_00960 [Spirochaetales bacterium]|nr:hypothetical protein [Spirochaetales bacterium]